MVYAPSGKLRLRKPELCLIGASIGGPDALAKLVKDLPKDLPPLVIAQHISVNFAQAFAEHLAKVSGLKLPKPTHGMPLENGNLYMAGGDYHVGVKRRQGKFYLVMADSPPVKRHRPSIDYMFSSLGEPSGGERIFAAILTGMGADGAEGILKLRKSGAMTFAQEPKSCVVFGMAKEAVKLGAITYLGTVPDIRRQLDLALQMDESKASSAE